MKSDNSTLELLADLAREVGHMYGGGEAAGASVGSVEPQGLGVELVRPDTGISWGVFVPLRIPVTAYFAQGDAVGFTRAVGLRGCALELPELGNDVRCCQLQLHFPDEEIRARARLKMTRLPICVARFETMNSESRELLYQTVSELAKIPVQLRAPRAPISLNVLVRDGEDTWKTLSVNISKSGVLVFSPCAPEVGTACVLRLYLGGLTFDTPAKVVRTEEDRVAFEFTNLGAAEDQALLEYLQAAGALQVKSAADQDEPFAGEDLILPRTRLAGCT